MPTRFNDVLFRVKLKACLNIGIPAVGRSWILNFYHDPKGGAARAEMIAQSPEVKTTKRTQPWFHGKQTSRKIHSHDTRTIGSRDLQDLAGPSV
jgi:hypothetical protein